MKRWFEPEGSRRMLWLPWAAILGCATAGWCAGAPSFAEFRQINEENFRAIRSGTIRMQYSQFERTRREDLENEVQNMRSALEGYAAQLEKRNIPAAQKKSLVETMERNLVARAKTRLEANQLESQSRTARAYTFDLSATRYRLDETALPSTGPALVNDRVIVTSAGIQVRYLPKVDEAVVDYFKNPIAKDLPAYLGVASPENLDQISDDDVVTDTAILEGRELVVYEASRAGTSDKLRIYVDPELGYRYRRIEFIQEGRIARTIVADRYESFGGIPFPRLHEDKYLEKGDKEVTRRATTMEVESAQFNQAIDPNVFRIRYSPHTRINDMKLGIRYQASPDVGAVDLISVEDLAERGLEEKVRLDLLAQSRSQTGAGTDANAIPPDRDAAEDPGNRHLTRPHVPSAAVGSGHRLFWILSLLALVLILTAGGVWRQRSLRQQNRQHSHLDT